MIKFDYCYGRPYFLNEIPLKAKINSFAFSEPFQSLDRNDLSAEKRPAGDFKFLITGCLYDRRGRIIGLSERVGGKNGDHVGSVNDFYKTPPTRAEISSQPAFCNKWNYLDGETLYIGHWMLHYGHFVVETLSKLWDLESIPRYKYIATLPFVFNKGRFKILPYQKYFLHCLGISAESIKPLGKKNILRKVTTPEHGWVYGGTVNTSVRKVYETIHQRHRKENKTGFCFVSRSQYGYNRITNLSAVEAVFKTLGFKVIHADKMPLKEQLELYANCQILAGISGSGLHNSLFASSDALIVDVGDKRSQDKVLCGQVAAVELMEQELIQVPYKEASDGGYDCEYLRHFVGDMLSRFKKSAGLSFITVSYQGVGLLPIAERLHTINKDSPCHINILKKIHENYELYDKQTPWVNYPAWKMSKVMCQYLEETGLLYRLDADKQYFHEAWGALECYLENIMGYIKDVGDWHHDIFWAETALAIIYMLEYFDSCLHSLKRRKLLNTLSGVYDKLWKLAGSNQALKRQGADLFAWNHTLIMYAVIGLCAIKFQAKAHHAPRLEAAILWVEGYLSFGLTADGFCREGVFYAGFTRIPLLLFLFNLKRYHQIDFFKKASIKNHWQYLIDEWHVGTRTFIPRNDSEVMKSTNVAGLLLYAYWCDVPQMADFWYFLVGDRSNNKTYGNPRLDYNHNGSLVLNYLYCPDKFEPVDLKPYVSPFRFYQDVGVVTGYSADPQKLKYSLQSASHLPSIHSQADHGHLSLYLYGDALLTDTGVGNSREPHSPSQSEGHNSLLINGRGMALAGKGWQTVSVMESAERVGDFHIARMNLAPAYNAYRSRVQVAGYQRLFIAHMKAPYFFVVLDDVIPLKRGQYDFCYRFHTDKNNAIELTESCIQVVAKHSKLDIVPFGLNWKEVNTSEFKANLVRSQYADCLFSAERFVGGYVLFPYKLEAPADRIECLDSVVSAVFLNISVEIKLLENEGVEVFIGEKGTNNADVFDFYL